MIPGKASTYFVAPAVHNLHGYKSGLLKSYFKREPIVLSSVIKQLLFILYLDYNSDGAFSDGIFQTDQLGTK